MKRVSRLVMGIATTAILFTGVVIAESSSSESTEPEAKKEAQSVRKIETYTEKQFAWDLEKRNATLSGLGYYTGSGKSREWVFHGPLEVRSVNGDLFRTAWFYEGLSHGPARSYYENGNLGSESFYIDGYEWGTSKIWTEDSVLVYSCSWKNGKKEGEEKRWYADGSKKTVATWSGDKKHGVETWWYSNGNLRRQYPYTNGVLDGLAKSWTEDGVLTVATYKDGKLVED